MDALQTILPRALAELLRQGPMSQGKLEVAWRTAVGDGLSRVTTVRLQSDGVVEVLPADVRWHQALKRSSHVILARLKTLLGPDAVTRLSLQGGPAEKSRYRK
jgi:predicted nucleic acid-binding Zn ribbon protein